MMSLFQAPIATLMFTVMWMQPLSGGGTVKSTLTSVMTSKSLSGRLMRAVEQYPGAVAIAYEVMSSNVIAASWPNSNLADDAYYTQTHINPHLTLPSLNNVSGSRRGSNAYTLPLLDR